MKASAQGVPKDGKKKKAEVTSERLLELCLAHFQRKGVDQTTMRELAAAAGLSPGAFYYHFASKEAVIQVFYEKTFTEFEGRCVAIFAETKKFEERLQRALEARLDTFEGHRPLLIALSRAAVDPTSPLSPFGKETKDIRDRTIAIFQRMLEDSDFKCDKRLLAHLPALLWMYLMGIIFFWVFDESGRQKKTRELIRLLTPQICRLVRFTRFPLTGSVINPLLATLELVSPKP